MNHFLSPTCLSFETAEKVGRRKTVGRRVKLAALYGFLLLAFGFAGLGCQQQATDSKTSADTHQADLGIQATPWGSLRLFDRLRPITTVPPRYPPAARAAGIEGKLVAVVLIAEDGTVGDVQIRVSSGDVRLDQAAALALKMWTYPVRIPAERCVTLQPMIFSLQEG